MADVQPHQSPLYYHPSEVHTGARAQRDASDEHLERSIAVPDFADFPSYSPVPGTMTSSSLTPSIGGLKPAAPIVSSPNHDLASSERVAVSPQASTASITSSLNTTSPSQQAAPETVSSMSLPSSQTFSMSYTAKPAHSPLPQMPTTPQRFPQSDMRRQGSLNRPRLPRSFSLGGAGVRRNPSTQGSPLAMTPVLQQQSPHISNSNTEPITPAEYALHIVFTQFVRQAEKKLTMCLAYSPDEEPPISSLLGSGADPAFDKILKSLGYIARQKPRPVIDAVMFWRKSKSEAASAAARDKAAVQQQHQSFQSTQQALGGRHKASKSLSDRSPIGHRNALRSPGTPLTSTHKNISLHFHKHNHTVHNIAPSPLPIPSVSDKAQQADRKSLISIYILCRVLIEVVKQTEVLGDEMGDKLEEIVFKQIKTADPSLLTQSAIRTANWNLFAELLGQMSQMRFASVSDMFIAELERTKGETNATKEQEINAQLVIHGMKYLRLKVYPMDAFEDSADFMESISNFFILSHGQRVKQAYCDVINQLLLSIAGVITAEVNHPTWVNAVTTSYPRAQTMFTKQRYWVSAFQLSCTLLCVAPSEYFSEHWVSLIEANYSKLKDRNCRLVFITGLCRLLWVYLHRCTESLNNVLKRLDTITKTLFLGVQRKQWLTAELGVVEACVQLIRVIGASHPEYCLKNIVFPLLSSDTLLSASDQYLSAEHLAPERMLVGIQSFLEIISDASVGRFPPFYAPQQQENAEEDTKNYDQKLVTDIPSSPLFKEHYQHFSQLLGKIMLICDSHFGGQAVLDEKLGHTLKTPSSSFSFTSAATNLSNANETAHAKYELLLTVFEAIPECIPHSVSFSKIVEILCKGSAHPDNRVSLAAANALKSLAKSGKCQTQTIVTAFARFIFNYEERYSGTTVEGGVLDASSFIESTLLLYVDLLNIWIDVIRQKTAEHREALVSGSVSNMDTPTSTDSSKVEEMEITSVWSVVEEVESNGLFFLCSQSRVVRRHAVMVLRLIRVFDSALAEQAEVLRMQPKKPAEDIESMSRIIDVLESPDGCGILNFDTVGPNSATTVSTAERVRLMQLIQEGKETGRAGILVFLAQSESGVDSALWLRIFPRFLGICLSRFPMPVGLCCSSVCGRLLHLYRLLLEIVDAQQKLASTIHLLDSHARHNMRTGSQVLIEQWKLYLIVACCTLTATDDQDDPSAARSQQSQSKRKGPPPLSLDFKRINSAKALFKMVIPLLQVDFALLREAVIAGLGCININLYKTLIESLEPMTVMLLDGRKVSPVPSSVHQSPSSSVHHFRRNKKQDGLRIAVAHVLQLTSHFLKERSIYRDSWILDRQIAFAKDTKNFLCQPEVQVDWECQQLRQYFCGFVQTLYEGIQRTSNPTKWLPFEARVSLFMMVEEWCGYGQYSYLAAERNERMRKSGLEQCRDTADQGVLMASIEVEKSRLELAALNAMASILEGSLAETIENHGAQAAVMSFDVRAIFTWTHSIFQSGSEKLHPIGRKAIISMLKSNRDFNDIFSKVITFCYSEVPGPKANESYFFAVADLLIEDPSYPCDVRQPLALGLFKIGDEKLDVRVKAAELLRAVESRYFGKCSVKEYEISISDRTTAVYKRAQFNLSNRFATEYEEFKYVILSELTMFFGVVAPALRRDMLAILIPWISTVELQLDSNGKDPSPSAYMVMTNLFDITVRFSSKIQNEIEALWVTLASGRHLGNVRAILDFLINSSVEKHDPAFVEYGKQIVVYLASTPAGAKLVEALVAYIQPTSMLVTREDPREYPGIEDEFPYIADLSLSLPPSNKEAQLGFSIGQLAMILLVDLMVSPVAAMSENLAVLLHVVFVLLDHFNPLVQEQARELLVHQIHELILSSETEIDTESYGDTAQFIDLIRRRDSQTVWLYDDFYRNETAMRTPKNMDRMIQKVFVIFMAKYPTLREEWSRVALTWATTCPVRHFACRSLQIFRSSFVLIDQNMLADMLVRLSNTIADSDHGIQNFAMQILMTLNAIADKIDIEDLANYPQIFWVTVACLQTVHQQEFIEGVTILEALLNKFSLSDPNVVSLFTSAFPLKWEGKFNGLQKALLPGLRSSKSYDQTMRVLDKLNELELNEIVGDNTRLLYGILANIPRFLHCLESGDLSQDVVDAAERLTQLAEQDGMPVLSRILNSLAKGRFRVRHDFIRQVVHALQVSSLFHDNEASVMVFLLGFLSNKIKYVQIETMEFLKYLFPLIDMTRPEFVALGADLISPLLRLLQSDAAEQALQVLDEATYIPGTEMDKHVLGASLGGFTTSTSTFGIPNEDGWAVPNHAVQAAVTRNNVHAVFYLCDVSNPEYQDPAMTVEFSRDEYALMGLQSPPQMRPNPSQLIAGMADGGYFGGAFGIRSDTMASYTVGDDSEGQLSHMVATLDNLNSFFAEEATGYTTVLE
ncbi:cell morphogenesis N-terminal-domain-containing protein [Lipomyces arxii]|uniref:cell morphogenesis N-terminal-domain-containing protein n=1 Tax=Lipomyces arxii TaxID=56418 RepID=UPI0034CE25EE